MMTAVFFAVAGIAFLLAILFLRRLLNTKITVDVRDRRRGGAPPDSSPATDGIAPGAAARHTLSSPNTLRLTPKQAAASKRLTP